MNNTVFIIFEDESENFPMYRLINRCPNVKVLLQQYDLGEEREPLTITYNQEMNFGFYEPETNRMIQLDLKIDRNVAGHPETYRKDNEAHFVREINLANQSNKSEEAIGY